MFKNIIFLFLLALFVFPLDVQSAMQSGSYVIYENIHHVFDGPVISSVNSSVSGVTANITWDTDVVANSYVRYSTDSSVPEASSSEQGSSLKNNTNHSVGLGALSANTTYYFRVKSRRVNGGISLSGINSFTTGADASQSTPDNSSSGGGGILIIDKSDKDAPELSNVSVSVSDEGKVSISWETNERATSFVEYGLDKTYGSVYGIWGSSTEHKVDLEKLNKGKTYYFRALSSDSWGNVGRSEGSSFSIGDDANIIEDELFEDLIIPEPDEAEKPDEAGILTQVTERTLEFLRRIFPEVSLNNISGEDLSKSQSMEELSRLVPAPILSGQPGIKVGATEATITWTSDIKAGSQVAIAPESNFRVDQAEPYQMIIGNEERKSTEHEVKIYNLLPDTLYHFQLRSRPSLGASAFSRDYSFKTVLEEFKIESFFTKINNNEEAIFRWITNKEADSILKFSPYHGNIIVLEEEKIIKNNSYSIIHEITVSELQAGIYYDIELQSSDPEGNIAKEIIRHFSTSENDLPPIISHVKADSTIFLDRSNKTQTIISWLTNEPASSRVYYQEGVHSPRVQLAKSTEFKTDYNREHVIVITKFKPGVVYSFRAESTDSGGNTTISKVHTFMTAKKKESIIQVIIRILEQTFGWIKELR